MLGLTNLRKKFFSDLSVRIVAPTRKPNAIVITHLLPDRPEFFDTLSQYIDLVKIIAIPYSLDVDTVDKLKNKFVILTPKLDELVSSSYLLQLVSSVGSEKEFILFDIGGYFSDVVDSIYSVSGTKFLGVVEDTEFGHRKYEANMNLPVAVVSVARSTLKRSEDALVGPSTFFSFERIVRTHGFVLKAKTILVLGYGKVGRNLAHTARAAGNHVCVFDCDPKVRIFALSEGFFCPSREEALGLADIVFGASGAQSVSLGDTEELKAGVVLISSSSKKVEFAVDDFDRQTSAETVRENVTKYTTPNGNFFYVIHSGQPANFLDGGVIGSALALTHGELIFAACKLATQDCSTGLNEVSTDTRSVIAQCWLNVFVDSKAGSARWNEM